MPISKPFQQRFTKLINDYNYGQTLTEIRQLMGISTASFSNALQYGVIPTPKTLIKIANFFQVSLSYLLGKSNSNDFSPALKPISFHERFAELCQENSVTNYKVSSACGFDSSIITRWFQKDYLPSLEILEVLCDYFKVSPDYLLGRTDFKD